MKGINVNFAVEMFLLMIVSYIILTVLIMFFTSTPQITYDRDIVGSNDQRHREICMGETSSRWIESCILNDTVLFKEEGIYQTTQVDKYTCAYKFLYKTGFNMSINCSERGKKCFIDKEYGEDIGKCIDD